MNDDQSLMQFGGSNYVVLLSELVGLVVFLLSQAFCAFHHIMVIDTIPKTFSWAIGWFS